MNLVRVFKEYTFQEKLKVLKIKGETNLDKYIKTLGKKINIMTASGKTIV